MAFFDDLGKKLSQAGQSAIQKTKDMTDIARINAAISEEEKKINNTYFQIGKLYVAKYTENHDADFAGMIMALKDAEAKICEYQQQVQDIKGIVRCEKCGAEVPNNVAFCSSCGAPMPKQVTPMGEDMVKCTGCGQVIAKNMRFCTGCGKPMAEILQSAAPAPAPVAQPAPMPVQPVGKTCPNCNAAVADGVAFCTECGTKI